MSVKDTECGELCGVMYVKPSVLKSHAGRIINSVHASQKVDVRDILDCDYTVIAQVVNKRLLDPISSRKEAAQQVSPCKPLPFDILSLNLYIP